MRLKHPKGARAAKQSPGCARLLAFVLALLAGCVSRVHEVKGPDGKTALAVKCGDATRCYQKAGELCPNGYDLVGNPVYDGSVTTLVVECKAAGTAKN